MAAIVFGIVAYAYQKEISEFTQKIVDHFYYNAYRDIRIDVNKSPNMVRAIDELIKINSLLEIRNTVDVVDGHNELHNENRNGTYMLHACLDENRNIKLLTTEEQKMVMIEQQIHNNNNTIITDKDIYNLEINEDNYVNYQFNMSIWIKKTDDTIYITCKKKITQDKLHKFANNIYKYYNSPQKVLIIYMSIDTKWKYPIYRRPRDINDSHISQSMRCVLDDIDNFSQNRQNYVMNGLPYKRGYLLRGKSGTGKTTLIELIAMTYNKSLYIVNLNSGSMDDSSLINLLSDVPINSLIVFEEIDRQIETLKTNKNINISDGGILTAIDGPQRLSDGTLVIMTSNETYEFSNEFKSALFRKGRIDKIFELV